jgi:cyclic pyranopterin phosphate synthase
MPAGGVDLLSHADILTFEEIERLLRLMTGLGIRRLKITGGEPLVRRGTIDLMRRAGDLPGIEQITLTTNGVLLEQYLDDIATMGIGGINISIDTLRRDRYERLTGFDGLDRVLRSIERASAILPVKLNVVPVGGVNDAELCYLAEFAREKVVAVRFIELMPVGHASRFGHIDTETVKAMMEARFGTMERCVDRIGNGPAVYVRPHGFKGKIGFIHAMSEAFCGACNRVRLTADGRFMPCLGQPDYTDLKQLLRSGATDAELTKRIRQTIAAKPAHHGFLNEANPASRDMNAIGG